MDEGVTIRRQTDEFTEDTLDLADQRTLLEVAKAYSGATVLVLINRANACSSDEDPPIILVKLSDDVLFGLEEVEFDFLEQFLDGPFRRIAKNRIIDQNRSVEYYQNFEFHTW